LVYSIRVELVIGSNGVTDVDLEQKLLFCPRIAFLTFVNKLSSAIFFLIINIWIIRIVFVSLYLWNYLWLYWFCFSPYYFGYHSLCWNIFPILLSPSSLKITLLLMRILNHEISKHKKIPHRKTGNVKFVMWFSFLLSFTCIKRLNN
jgi:hypothetical protein